MVHNWILEVACFRQPNYHPFSQVFSPINTWNLDLVRDLSFLAVNFRRCPFCLPVFWTCEVHMFLWLVVWNINFISPYIGNNHPNWPIFFRGVETTNHFFCYCRSNVCCTRNSSDITTIFYVNGSCVTATYHIVQKIFAPFSILGLDEQSEWEYQNWVESEDVGYCWEFLGRCQERYELGPCTRLPSSSKARSGIFFPPGGVNARWQFQQTSTYLGFSIQFVSFLPSGKLT